MKNVQDNRFVAQRRTGRSALWRRKLAFPTPPFAECGQRSDCSRIAARPSVATGDPAKLEDRVDFRRLGQSMAPQIVWTTWKKPVVARCSAEWPALSLLREAFQSPMGNMALAIFM
jgi:hypothetical protein